MELDDKLPRPLSIIYTYSIELIVPWVYGVLNEIEYTCT